jgi:Domain of unknown function (DUF4129)
MMSSPAPRLIPQKRVLVLLFAALAAPLARAQSTGANQPDAAIVAYRRHLEALQGVVSACSRQRTWQACSPSCVGSDDRVQWKQNGATVTRVIRYDWLREALERAGEKQEPQKPAALPVTGIASKPVSVEALLAQSQRRLQADWKQAEGLAPEQPGHAAERRAMDAILAHREYQGVTETSVWQRFQEWLENLLANLFGRLIGFGSRSPWIAFALRALLIGSLCIALVWALVRLERRSRMRLIPQTQPAAAAPSARQWQLWLQDAQRMAAQGLWREAIHFLYWSTISRLESRGMWPADRARTPREYLCLFPASDPRRESLTGLTHSFETTWYGGREARAADFEAARHMATGLGVE